MITNLLNEEIAKKFKLNANFDDEEFKRLARKENLKFSGDMSKTVRRIRDAVHIHNDDTFKNNYMGIKVILDDPVNIKSNLLERLKIAKEQNDEEKIKKAEEKIILKDYFTKVAKLEGKAVRELFEEKTKLKLEKESEPITQEEPIKETKQEEIKTTEELQEEYREYLKQEIEEEKKEIKYFIESVEEAKTDMKTKSPQESLEMFKWLNYNAENYIEVFTEEDREKLEKCQEEMKEIIKTLSKLLGVEYIDPIEEKEKEIKAFEEKQNEIYTDLERLLHQFESLIQNFDNDLYFRIIDDSKEIKYNSDLKPFMQHPKFNIIIEKIDNLRIKANIIKEERDTIEEEKTLKEYEQTLENIHITDDIKKSRSIIKQIEEKSRRIWPFEKNDHIKESIDCLILEKRRLLKIKETIIEKVKNINKKSMELIQNYDHNEFRKIIQEFKELNGRFIWKDKTHYKQLKKEIIANLKALYKMDKEQQTEENKNTSSNVEKGLGKEIKTIEKIPQKTMLMLPAPNQERTAQKIESINNCKQIIEDCFKEIRELPIENQNIDPKDWRIIRAVNLEKKPLEKIPEIIEIFRNACNSEKIEEQNKIFDQLLKIFEDHYEKIRQPFSKKLRIFKRAFLKMLRILEISKSNRICLKKHIFIDTSKIQNNACLTNTQEVLKENIQNTEIEENKGIKTSLQVINNITRIQENPKQPDKIKHTFKLLRTLRKENKKVAKTMKKTLRYILREATKKRIIKGV